jgi:hypothetical protein
MLFLFNDAATNFSVSGGNDRVDSAGSSTTSIIEQLDDPTVEGTVGTA